jgi:putative salt-induced outer membrane protein
MVFRRCGLLVLLICITPAQAQWSGEIAAGYLATSGNTSTQSLNGKLGLDYTRESWKNSFKALSVYSTDQGEASSERYAASNKTDWNFSERNYVFASLDWEKDLFGGIRERTSETLGYGRKVLVGPTHLLDLEIGAGARQSKANLTGEREQDLIFRGSGLYTWKISETSEFKQALKVESGESNTFGEALSELKLSIVGNLFASLSYTLRHNTDVPEGTDRTDSFTAVNLSYGFGGG